ncbi:MAG: NAD(P)H-dependent oxidoreductase, partial [Firmicutes bacterium]|nr:NAD(P)H-dependent oxidoreductase [Bacillota bacterium]
MKKLAIFAHPDLGKSSVSATWINEFAQHTDITIHKLSESHKGYAFDIKQEQQLVKEHDRILIVIPL